MKALLLALVTVAMLTLTSTAFADHRCRQPRRVYRAQPQVQLFYDGHGWGVRLTDDSMYRSSYRRSYYRDYYDYRGHHGYRSHHGHHRSHRGHRGHH